MKFECYKCSYGGRAARLLGIGLAHGSLLPVFDGDPLPGLRVTIGFWFFAVCIWLKGGK